jgi:hypothetical protein
VLEPRGKAFFGGLDRGIDLVGGRVSMRSDLLSDMVV